MYALRRPRALLGTHTCRCPLWHPPVQQKPRAFTPRHADRRKSITRCNQRPPPPSSLVLGLERSSRFVRMDATLKVYSCVGRDWRADRAGLPPPESTPRRIIVAPTAVCHWRGRICDLRVRSAVLSGRAFGCQLPIRLSTRPDEQRKDAAPEAPRFGPCS